MRIAIFAGQFPCLSETFILDQIVGLIKRGHSVDIIAFETDGSSINQAEVYEFDLPNKAIYLRDSGFGLTSLRKHISIIASLLGGVNVSRLPLVANSLLPNTSNRQFIRLLSALDKDFDAVHCHFGTNGELAVAARERLKKSYPIITSFHGCDMRREDGVARYEKLFQHGDAFIANTKYTREKLCEMGVKSETIHVLPVGVNISSTSIADRSKENTSRIRLLTVARLVPFKGIENAINAIKTLKLEGVECDYTIVGSGPLQTALSKQIDFLHLSDSVRLVGAQSRTDIFNRYLDADIFVLPSIEHEGRTETQGLVLQEAQMIGLPVVASRVGGIPEGLSEANKRFLFTAGNVNELVASIKLAGQVREQWPVIASQGQEFIRQNYDNTVLSERMERIYMECRLARAIHPS